MKEGQLEIEDLPQSSLPPQASESSVSYGATGFSDVSDASVGFLSLWLWIASSQTCLVKASGWRVGESAQGNVCF